MKEKMPKASKNVIGTPNTKTNTKTNTKNNQKDKLLPVGERSRMTAGNYGYDLEGQL